MAETVHFSTLLRPHRSLPPDGFKWLIRGVLLANLLVALPMYLLGAWPIAGFCGLDVALLWWLFDRNYFDAKRSETLTLTDRELVVVRIAPDGEREEHRLAAYWLKVDLGERRLVVSSRGNRGWTSSKINSKIRRSSAVVTSAELMLAPTMIKYGTSA